MRDDLIYKILDAATWRDISDADAWPGSEVDLRDGFVHFSTAAQLPGTLRLHYAGRAGLVIVAFSAPALGAALNWEPSRGGDLFPHLYAPLPPRSAVGVWPVDVAADGACVLPAEIGT
ncbi:MAG: DUF952 domain-containing protein [Alphaproteobacteria bacterium]|nr:DUF952 domain-containing protein [Alphaproteobacteria bacterium]